MVSNLPDQFVLQMNQLLGQSAIEFFEALSHDPCYSIRLNPHKKTDLDTLELDHAVAWHDDAYYLKKRPVFTLDPLFHAGAYYVQEASSMFVLKAIESIGFDLTRPLRILDLCSAPGGKTTLLSELGSHHLIVANEVIKSRYHILNENLTRWGIRNLITLNYDVDRLTDFEGYFDIVLVDAPCSGEGLFRKDSAASSHWSEDAVNHCSLRQKRILERAKSLVKRGGLLLYSTCTYNRSENINQIQSLCEEGQFVSLKLNDIDQYNLFEYDESEVFGYQFFPHLVKGEGFFLSILQCKEGKEFKEPKFRIDSSSLILKKQKELLGDSFEIDESRYYFLQNDSIKCIDAYFKEDVQWMLQKYRGNFGIPMASIKKDLLIPEHDAVMNPFINHRFPSEEISREQALKFLKKEAIALSFSGKSWLQVNYKGQGLGWVKSLGNRVNNYLPKNLRIRMRID